MQVGESVVFSGYHISANGIQPIAERVQAIKDYPTPSDVRTLKGFLGALNFYRRALPKLDGKHSAEVLQNLYDACNTKVPTKKFTTIWKEKGLQKDFDNAKKLLTLAIY